MNVLASTLAEAMAGSDSDLVMLDTTSGTWSRHPWPEVHARAENVADRVGQEGSAAVGLVGDPTVELISAIPGAMFAGAAVSILPGPVRGADPAQWAQATLARFRAIGVRTVFSHGDQLALLRGGDDAIVVHDVSTVAHAQRSVGLTPSGAGDIAILQGTAGSTGTPRTAQISAAAVLANNQGLIARVGIAPEDRGHSWLPIYHDMVAGVPVDLRPERHRTLAGPDDGVRRVALRLARVARRESRHLDRRAEHGLPPHGQVLQPPGRRRPEPSAVRPQRREPVDCDGTERFATGMARFGFDAGALSPSYGLAESTCAVTVPAPGTGMRVDEVSVDTEAGPTMRRHAVLGEAIPGMQVRVNPAGAQPTDVTGREVGEIEIRGTSLMSCYVGEGTIDAEDWLPTGDLGYFVDGGLVVCGRAKELITIAGRNVFHTEVERVATQVKGVREGAVVAIGTSGHATRPGLVIAAEFRGADEPAARSELVRRVASECGVVPADVVFVKPGSLPRTSSGKLRRLEVKRNLEVASR